MTVILFSTSARTHTGEGGTSVLTESTEP